jgi:hypothetical protein
MFSTDHFYGAFDEFPTDLKQDADGTWVASAMGLEARHQYQEQALNDLNAALLDAVSKGELVPNMGN